MFSPETAMRKTKREIIGAKGADDEEQFTVKSVLLRRQREEYNAFSEKAGLLTQNERTQVYGFDKSMASKSSWAARKIEKLEKEADALVKTKTADGYTVSEISKHLKERMRERDFSASDIKNALTNPLDIGKIRADGTKQYVGEKATVAINAKTGKLTTGWKTSTKKAEKLKKKAEKS